MTSGQISPLSISSEVLWKTQLQMLQPKKAMVQYRAYVGNAPRIRCMPLGNREYEFTKVQMPAGPVVICEMGPFGKICGAAQTDSERGALCLQLYPRDLGRTRSMLSKVPEDGVYSVQTVPGIIEFNAYENRITTSPFLRPDELRPLTLIQGFMLREFMRRPDEVLSHYTLWTASHDDRPDGYVSTSASVRYHVGAIRRALGTEDSKTGYGPKEVLVTVPKKSIEVAGGYMLQSVNKKLDVNLF